MKIVRDDFSRIHTNSLIHPGPIYEYANALSGVSGVLEVHTVESEEGERMYQVKLVEYDEKDLTSEIRTSQNFAQFFLLPRCIDGYNQADETTWLLHGYQLVQLYTIFAPENIRYDEEAEKTMEWIHELRRPAWKRLKEIKPRASVPMKCKLDPHQIEALNFAIDHKSFMLCDEQGLGKTIEALSATLYRKDHDGIRKCLILSPSNVVPTWIDEIHNATYESVVNLTAVSAKEKLGVIRDWIEDSDAFFAVINYEGIRPEAVQVAFQSGIQMVVADEAHLAKNSASQQGKALTNLNWVPYKIAMTGTPTTSKARDLFNTLAWVGGCGRYDQYKRDFNTRAKYGFLKLHLQLSCVMLRRTKEEVMKLPEKTIETVEIDLTELEQKLYDGEENALWNSDWSNMTQTHAFARLRHLRSVTSGLEIGEVVGAKMQWIQDMVEQISPNEKVLIFSFWREGTEKMARVLFRQHPVVLNGNVPKKERINLINQFKTNPDCKVLCCTYNVGGLGLTLTEAYHVIALDLPWTAAGFRQAIDRAHRRDQTHPVSVTILNARKTVDWNVMHHVQDSGYMLDMILDGTAEGTRPFSWSKEEIYRILTESRAGR